jgi:hypothetical protein
MLHSIIIFYFLYTLNYTYSYFNHPKTLIARCELEFIDNDDDSDDDDDDDDDDELVNDDTVDIFRVDNLMAKCVILPSDSSFFGGIPTGIIDIRCTSFVSVCLSLSLELLVHVGRNTFGYTETYTFCILV